ncbi:ADP-L-glycero-D-manno-heptose-6-epimerase [uncultured archaeon]|nr:ADP-L-glycero-D-manno-heptose-6-epimerase [uncultured archaeon]
MRKGKTPVIYGDGEQTRDFVYVKDVVHALQTAMKSDYHGILNVGTGKAYSFNNVIEILNKKLGLSIKPKYKDNPIKNYVMHTRADTGKAEREIGFKAKYQLEEGISNIV